MPSPSGDRHNFVLQMDNAGPHIAYNTVLKLEEWGVRLLAHPPNSPNLAPCDFALFPKLKEPLRGTKFANLAELQKETLRILRKMPKQVFFQAISDLTIRWQKCLSLGGSYFEGAHVPVDIVTFTVNEGSDSDSDSD